MEVLRTYLADADLSMAEFGKRLKPPVSDATVSRWCARVHIPRRGHIQQIEQMTDGAVSAAAWFEPPADAALTPAADQPSETTA